MRAVGERAAVVCLHGAGSDRTIWRDVGARLSTSGIGSVALDYPGRNEAPGPPRETAAALADAVLSDLDALALPRVVLVGHSLGGLVSQRLARVAPRRVAGLVLVGTTAKYRDLPDLRASIARDFAAFALGFADLVCGPRAGESLRASVTATLVRVSGATLIADLRAAGEFDGRLALGDLRVPAVVVSGELDRVAPAAAGERLARGIAGAELRVLEEVGHMIPVEAPEAVAEAVRAVLSRAGGCTPVPEPPPA